jgi:hypothetical protein
MSYHQPLYEQHTLNQCPNQSKNRKDQPHIRLKIQSVSHLPNRSVSKIEWWLIDEPSEIFDSLIKAPKIGQVKKTTYLESHSNITDKRMPSSKERPKKMECVPPIQPWCFRNLEGDYRRSNQGTA